MSGWRRAGMLVCTALLAAIVLAPSPAQAITSVYALQASAAGSGGTLVQYAVGPGGTLAPSPPDIPLGATPQDIAVTLDGRFAYVTTVAADGSSSIVALARVTPGGRLELNGPPAGPLAGSARGIVVNPQGTRVYYAQPGFSVFWRAIGADGTLGPANPIAIPGTTPPPDVRFLAMSPDGRSLYAADANGSTSVTVWQFDIDPATGNGSAKSTPSAAWPAGGGPTSTGRMAITPAGSHLYLAPDAARFGVARWTIDPGSGQLVGGTVEATPAAGDPFAEAVVAISPSGAALWAPSASTAIGGPPERIRQFAINAGALTPLAPPAVAYPIGVPARDAIPSPDGATLYLGQNGSAGEWTVAPGGTLSHRANTPSAPTGGVVNAGIALSPSQAPVASFAVDPGPAGAATRFDAAGSADPDGSIVRYDWDFGDGTGAGNAGPAPTHVYASPGTPTVTLAVTDADGTSTSILWTGTRTLRNGGPSAVARRSFTIAAASPPLPRPHKGRSVTVQAASGKLFVRVPGSPRYVPIAGLTEIPLGSIIDARKGRARITAEVDVKTGRTQSSLFYDWFFRILQTKGSKAVTEARLVKGSFAGCTPKRRARSSSVLGPDEGLHAQTAARRKRSKRKVRHLWGRGNGSFRTGGKRSSATVRGTWWIVEDRCDGTLTRVKTGRVDVRDFRLKKTIRLRPGRQYLAKAP